MSGKHRGFKYWRSITIDASGTFEAVTTDGVHVHLPWGVAVELGEGLAACISSYQRGRFIDGVAWCAACGERSVNPEAGEDTCSECLRLG